MVNNKIYSASYTSGGLLQRETTTLLPLIRQDLSCAGFQREKKENKYLLINSEVSRRKILDEIRKRARHSTTEFWWVFEKAEDAERSILLYYLCLKTYRLLWTFHFDLLVSRWRSLQQTLEPYDFKQKLDELSTQYPEVDAWTDQTKYKIIQVSRLMMVQAGFLNGNQIQKPSIPTNFYRYFAEWDDPWMLEGALLKESERNVILHEVQ